MKKILILPLIATAIFANENNTTTKEQMPPVVKEGIKYIKMVGKELKSNVKAKMQEDKSGVKAAEFCANNAKEVMQKVTKNFPENVKVRRVALKYRNPNNKPDSVDLEVLTKMQEALKNQTLQKKPQVVDVNGTKRVYVPLIVEKACLKCHGDINSMNPQIKKIIAKKYPNDKAVNFKEGDLRGAVVAEIKPKK